MKKVFLTLVMAVLAAFVAEAGITLRQPCSDGMVLQQNTDAVIWGLATAGSQISVSADWGAKARVKTDENGFWQLTLRTPSASYDSHVIRVKGDGDSIEISDVLVGEVWMASGQSNMEITMRGYHNCPIKDAINFVASPVGPNRVRIYMEPVSQSYEPVTSGKGRWLRADRDETWDMSATAFFFARQLNESLDVPVGIVACPYGGSRVESWIPESQIRAWGDDVSPETMNAMVPYHRPFLAYNAMFNPICGYTVKGFIWYQGCSNVGAHEAFPERMAWLIRHWRQRCANPASPVSVPESFDRDGSDLPFYMVEIAPYNYGAGDGISYAALLRQAQHQVAEEVENCGIVVTNDLVAPYEKDNIHPARKQEIGQRLAFFALNRQYGFKALPCDSPRVKNAVYADGQVAMHVDNLRGGISRLCEIEGLELCVDGKWIPATTAFARWEDGMLYVPSETRPSMISYGWGDFKPGNLYDGLGLPLTPFCVPVQ